MNDIIYISKIIINNCLEKNFVVNITKIQKLLYVVYGTYLYQKEEALFNESPLCLPYGPVFKSVYDAYKCGELKISKYDLDDIKDSNLNNIIESVVKNFGRFPATSLSKWSHRENSAWSKAYVEDELWGNKIKDSHIREEFSLILGGSLHA